MDIFTDEELKAADAGPNDEPDTNANDAEPAEDQPGQPRAADGKFAPREEAEPVEEAREKGGTVPQQALHAEREKRKGVEAELTTLREQLAAIQKMREQVAARQPEAMPAADDPAAVEHLRSRLAQTEQQTSRIANHLDNQALQQQEMQQLGTFMQQSETHYRQQQPDYDDAINHVVQKRAQELSLYGLTPPQIQQAIREEATEIVRSAVQQGRDPAELGYQIALSRGYAPKQADASPAPNAAQATMDAIAKAKGQSKSLGSAAGSTPKMLNAEAVLKMTPEEFDAVYSTPEGKAMIDGL